MKNSLIIILIIVLSFLLFGYYANENGKLYIGIGVSIFAFLLMPLFIYHRYKDRMGEFIDSRMEKEENTKI